MEVSGSGTLRLFNPCRLRRLVFDGELRVDGPLRVEEALEVDGEALVEGGVEAGELVVVAGGSLRVEGWLRAREATVLGTLRARGLVAGWLLVDGKALVGGEGLWAGELLARGSIVGDVVAARAVVERDGSVEGAVFARELRAEAGARLGRVYAEEAVVEEGVSVEVLACTRRCRVARGASVQTLIAAGPAKVVVEPGASVGESGTLASLEVVGEKIARLQALLGGAGEGGGA